MSGTAPSCGRSPLGLLAVGLGPVKGPLAVNSPYGSYYNLHWECRCARHAVDRSKVLPLMTTLTGIQLEDYCVLAADSQITEDNLRTISTVTPKIVSVGRYLLGITGDSRPGDILTYNWSPPKYTGADPVQWMGKKMLPSIISAFKENGYDPYEATKEKDAGFDYLLAFNGNLFHIAVDLSFIQSKHHIYGLGSGGQFALGYLVGLPTASLNKDPERHAEKAVQLASMLDVNTHPPIQLITQRREY